MAMPRKLDELHALHGTRPHDRAEGTPVKPGRPRFPRNGTPEEKVVFKRLCKLLAERRTLTEGDECLLTLAASLWMRRERAQAKLLKEGEVRMYTRLDSHGQPHEFEKPNLHLKVAENAEKQLVGILDRLGLSPLAIGKVRPAVPAPPKVVDPIASYLSGEMPTGQAVAVMVAPDDMEAN